MNVADIIIAGVIIAMMAFGWRRSALVQVCGLIGIILGFFLSGLIYEKLAFLTQDSTIRNITMIAILIGTIFLSTDLLVVLGRYAEKKQKILRHFRSTQVNRIVAAGVTGIGSLLIIVFLNGVAGDALPNIARQQLKNSSLLTLTSANLPLPTSITNLAALRKPFGEPTIFSGEEVLFDDNTSTIDNAYAELDEATEKTKSSVVKITTWGCGSIATGSGFIIDPHHVVTNAHVVAGGERISLANNDATYMTDVVWIDPKLDVAVLYVQSDLVGEPLKVANTSAAPGTLGAQLGFQPAGFDIGDVVVTGRIHASGYDIYRQTQVVRDIYALRGNIIPGNSGGPVINAKGAVIGVIIGHSTTQNKTGYAIVSSQIVDLVKKSPALLDSVSTGECVADS